MRAPSDLLPGFMARGDRLISFLSFSLSTKEIFEIALIIDAKRGKGSCTTSISMGLEIDLSTFKLAKLDFLYRF